MLRSLDIRDMLIIDQLGLSLSPGLNVLTGERYKSISKETAGVLKGEYGATPAPVNSELQQRVLEGKTPIICRPADELEPELALLTDELKKLCAEKSITLTGGEGDPVEGRKVFKNRKLGNCLACHVNSDMPEELFHGEVFKTVVPRNVRLGEAPSYGKTIVEYAPRSTGAKAYIALAAELLQRARRRARAAQKTSPQQEAPA